MYIGFCAADTAEYACSNSLVESIVYAPEEHPDFHKDLELYSKQVLHRSEFCKTHPGER